MFELTTRKSSDILEADWEMENDKWEMGMENGNGKMANGKWEMEKWQME